MCQMTITAACPCDDILCAPGLCMKPCPSARLPPTTTMGDDVMRIVPWLAAALLAATSVSAAELPCSQGRLIVPYPAGGPTGVATRVVAERLEAAFKKPFVVENRGGATGNIGTVAVVTAPADGCTLLVNATIIATFPVSFNKLAYDPFKDLAPVGGMGV